MSRELKCAMCETFLGDASGYLHRRLVTLCPDCWDRAQAAVKTVADARKVNADMPDFMKDLLDGKNSVAF